GGIRRSDADSIDAWFANVRVVGVRAVARSPPLTAGAKESARESSDALRRSLGLRGPRAQPIPARLRRAGIERKVVVRLLLQTEVRAPAAKRQAPCQALP